MPALLRARAVRVAEAVDDGGTVRGVLDVGDVAVGPLSPSRFAPGVGAFLVAVADIAINFQNKRALEG